ncbi:MAG: hypothetical protein ACW960_06945 [Candidatus Thorarchaeota archaeon]|jgi:uncharacterized membrane protein YphA (DoxX/SURF4 family)
MQSPEIILSNELFTVSVILWVGTFTLLLWLFIRMSSLDKTIKTLASASGQELKFQAMPNKMVAYVALILELLGAAVLLIGLFAWIPIPLFPMSIVIWVGVFIMLLWQMLGVSSIEDSLAMVSSEQSQE